MAVPQAVDLAYSFCMRESYLSIVLAFPLRFALGCLLLSSIAGASAEPLVQIQELPVSNRANVGGSVVLSPAHEFTFARLTYSGGFEWPRWRADWPDAEYHFSQGLQRLSRVDTNSEGTLVNLKTDELYDFPWLYAVEVGHMYLSPAEQDRLREYLLRGGFLMVDDFHGAHEWRHFETLMKSIFPNRKMEKLEKSSEPFQLVYAIDSLIQIPGIRAVMSGKTWEKGGTKPLWLGITDDLGRIMVAVNFNQDLGDAWEHADDAQYPERFTGLAYRMGVNYVIYSMTH